MTFEEAWPSIKERKEFRYRDPAKNEDWSPWMKHLEYLGTVHLNYLLTLEFQIKREPMELWICQGPTEYHLSVGHNKHEAEYGYKPEHRRKTFKVREVIE